MSDERTSRRQFFRSGTQIGIGLATTPVAALAATKPGTPSPSQLPRIPVAASRALARSKPISFSFPDPASPCLMVKTGKPCPDGVGPEQDIVAYSLLCPHQGFPLVYDAGAAVFKCANHFSQFDAQMMGQMVCGQATAKLPRIWLEWDADSDMIHATGVSGLIYGRISNIMG